jgi:hypothetical protein
MILAVTKGIVPPDADELQQRYENYGCWSGDPPRRTSYAGGAQVTPEAHKFRQRRRCSVPPQAGRTRFRPRRSHRLVLSANIGMILRTQTPAHTDSFGQQRQKFYLVVVSRPTTA